MTKLCPSNPNLFFSKNDPMDLRLGDFVVNSDTSASHAIWGYPDDEGIQLNGGRIGAASAPDHIRKTLYKCTPPTKDPQISIADLGNLDTSQVDLLTRHEMGRQLFRQHLENNKKIITLGGGHDYGYSDAGGFNDFYKGKKRVVINFDAHLDVRPFENNIAHSGTPFRRMLEETKDDKLLFVEAGIQPQCNSPQHLKWATENGALIFKNNHAPFLWGDLKKALTPFSSAPLFISFDIDVLSVSQAPGCSQAWPGGLDLREVLEFFSFLHENFDWCGLGVYEVSPPLDIDNITAKSATQLIHRFLFKDTI